MFVDTLILLLLFSEMEYMRIKELKSYQKKISIKTNVATDEDNG